MLPTSDTQFTPSSSSTTVTCSCGQRFKTKSAKKQHRKHSLKHSTSAPLSSSSSANQSTTRTPLHQAVVPQAQVQHFHVSAIQSATDTHPSTADVIGSSMVSTPEAVADFVDNICILQKTIAPILYIDLEGVRLSRDGSISIVTVFVQPGLHVYLLDVHNLQTATFTTPGISNVNITFQTILESRIVVKVFFDVRNDSDALHAHFGIRLAAVEDIQLMENATRKRGMLKYLNWLDKCIAENTAAMLPSEKDAWMTAKDKGKKLFDPRHGGSYEAFNERPLASEVELYCVNDVKILPMLRAMYMPRLGAVWRAKVYNETTKRVWESQQPAYDPHSREKRFGPWGWGWK
ncbi:hypothetical protein MCOR25_010985 [Pyricularia grisea]|nr:hypothetical protein MCOR25_010985 [Pyricularia grisea]